MAVSGRNGPSFQNSKGSKGEPLAGSRGEAPGLSGNRSDRMSVGLKPNGRLLLRIAELLYPRRQ